MTPGRHRSLLASTLTLLLALTVAQPAAGQPDRPGPDRALTRPQTVDPRHRLTAAFASGNSVGLERAASLLGVAGMQAIFSDPNSPEPLLLAALASAPLLATSWYLLAPVAELVRHRSPRVALAAARAARAIAETCQRCALERHEEFDVTLRPAIRAILALATERERPIDIRVEALLAVAQWRSFVQLKEGSLLRLLSAPEPAIRQAATQLFAGQVSTAALTPLAKLAAADAELCVARAAAAVICAALPRSRAQQRLLLATLHNTGAAARLSQLATSRGATADEMIDIARCLRASSSADDQRVLRALLRDRVVQRAVRRLR